MPHSIFGIGSLLKQVIDLRTVAGLRLFDAVLARRQKLLQRSLGIGNVAKGADLGRAGLDTGRHLAAVHAMGAKGALLHHALVLPEKASVVRTRDDAVPAADTLLFVDHHDAVVALERCAGGAHPNARRSDTVVA